MTSRKVGDLNGQRVLPMNDTWNEKKRVGDVLKKQGSLHTHENIFARTMGAVKPGRTKNLM